MLAKCALSWDWAPAPPCPALSYPVAFYVCPVLLLYVTALSFCLLFLACRPPCPVVLPIGPPVLPFSCALNLHTSFCRLPQPCRPAYSNLRAPAELWCHSAQHRWQPQMQELSCFDSTQPTHVLDFGYGAKHKCHCVTLHVPIKQSYLESVH